MEERRLRAGSLVEWLIAALGVLGLAWLIAVPLQRTFGPRVEAAPVDTSTHTRDGVPLNAISVPVMLLADGREIRSGDLRSHVDRLLGASLAGAPMMTSHAEFGERHTRVHRLNGARVIVVCEPTEKGGPMRVSRIYLP